MTSLRGIRIRDPYLVVLPGGAGFVLHGSTDADLLYGPGTGFDCWTSSDLLDWRGPFPAFRPPPGFWSTGQFWAPEVHEYRGHYFMLATFGGVGVVRGTQVLIAEEPTGPFAPWSDGPVTPRRWHCLDGTLHIDGDGDPWVVYCHEWVQVGDGAIVAQRLTQDLRSTTGSPVRLFTASQAPWVRPVPEGTPLPPDVDLRAPAYVTDGPFLHRTADGTLLLLWSSFGDGGYAIGLARSESGLVTGPWTQQERPLWSRDGGHGMIARLPDGELLLVFHHPNDTPNERAVLRRVRELPGGLELAPEPGPGRQMG
jgi:arabinan endo-1,5-alpha-L-arabinosidase